MTERSMVPLDHPEYRGFTLTETDHPKTPPLRELAAKLDRCQVEASYECYEVVFYMRSDTSPDSPSQAEMLNVPKANRARLVTGCDNEGVDCTSPEEAVKTWVQQRHSKSANQ